MSELTKEQILGYIPEMITEMGTKVAIEEILQFEKDNPGVVIDSELRETIVQRSIADLSFSSSEFRTHALNDLDDLKENYAKWFHDRTEQQLRRMLSTNIRSEIQARQKAGEEELSFIDSFRKKVKEQSKDPGFHF